MATLPKSGNVTYEEWLKMPEVHECREEVVNGEIRLMPPNKLVHAVVVSRLAAALLRQLDPARYYVFSGSFGLVIRKQPLTCREPDIAVFERSTVVEMDGYLHSAPQVAVEVLSPSETRRSIEEKLLDYQSIGLSEVWLVSPEGGTVEILLLENGLLRRSAILAEGILKPTRFPHVQIDIAEIWPD
jgi:Uma2 family endonuclease